MQRRINCWEAFHEEGGRLVKKGDTIIANESDFGLYDDREYNVLDVQGTLVQIEIFPGKTDWYSIEYFDFPLDSL